MSAKKANSKYVPQPTSSRSTWILGGIAIVVIAAVVIIGVIWQSGRNETRNEGYGSVKNSAVQVQLQPGGIVRLGTPEATKTIDMYEDSLCPVCAQFEQMYGQEIAQAVDEGKFAVQYHLLDFLNPASASGNYSTRAAAAAQCVAESGNAEAYGKFHTDLFDPANQPKERGSSDHSNEDLAQLAKQAGAPDAAVSCISGGTKVSSAGADAQSAKAAMAALGGKGTPSVFNGTTAIDIGDTNWVSKVQ